MLTLLKNIFVLISFVGSLLTLSPRIFSQGLPNLPYSTSLVSISSAFTPIMIKGLKVDPAHPWHLDFIIDTGDAKLSQASLQQETRRLIQYFLAALTVPDEDLWVNLSPYEKSRIIPQGLSQTQMGRDLLGQDLGLKQITASLTYPESSIGKEFWSKVYKEAQEQYKTTQIPVNTFNKVWIVPDRAVVYEHDSSSNKVFALLGENHLKVMLEEDYLALSHHVIPAQAGIHGASALASQAAREVLIPQLVKEVNTGKNFAEVRQISGALILAAWFKKNLKESWLGQEYSNKNKVLGIQLQEKNFKEKIYHQYLTAFRKGVYNYIKEESFPPLDGEPASASLRRDGGKGGVIARKYFSGGYDGVHVASLLGVVKDPAPFSAAYARTFKDYIAPVDLLPVADAKDAAQTSLQDRLKQIQDSDYQGFPVVDGKKNIPMGIQYALAYYDLIEKDNNPLRAMIKEGRLRAGPDNQQIIQALRIETLQKPIVLVSTDPENEVDYVLIKLMSGDDAAGKFRAWKKIPRSNISTLALHTGGVIATSVAALDRYGIFDLFKSPQGGFRTITMKDIVEHVEQLTVDGQKIKFNTPNRGYIHGVLYVLNLAGWLTRQGESASDEMQFTLTAKGKVAIRYADRYALVGDFIKQVADSIPEFFHISAYLFNRPDAPKPTRSLRQLAQLAQQDWDIPASADPNTAEEIRGNLNGYLVGNLALSLYLEGVFNLFDANLEMSINDIKKAKEIQGDTDELQAAFDIFTQAGLLENLGGGRYRKTMEGLVTFDRLLAYGVPFSYRASYDFAEQFLFGNVQDIKRHDKDDKELLVYRKLNSLSSGASHPAYFKKVDPFVKDMIRERIKLGEILQPDKLSNKEPFVLAIADTGCGDGTFLAHMYHVIVHDTDYGKWMKEFPDLYKLDMVGLDYNEDSRRITHDNLQKQGINHIVLFGDIGDPMSIVKRVDYELDSQYQAQGIHKIRKMVIHTRTFLDHDRDWKLVADTQAAARRVSTSKGAYAWLGRAIPNNEIEQNSYEHYRAWADALRATGQRDLINIELGTIDPDAAARKIRKTLIVAYFLSHLFSDQFIVEVPVYLRIIKEAGFQVDNNLLNHKYFPPGDPELFNVSVDYFTLEGASVDASMRVNDQSDVGGIDLNPALGTIDIKRDSQGRELAIGLQPVSRVRLMGLEPVLLKMVPIETKKFLED